MRVWIAAWVLGMALAGCKKEEAGVGPSEAEGDAGAGAGAGSGSGSGGGGWAELLGLKRAAGASATLEDVVKGYPGYEKCLERLQAALPPDLGADMLAFYNVPDALCRTREAMAQGTTLPCARILSYSMKRGCEQMAAIYARKPDACPMGYPGRQGREGYCLALSQRDPALCRGSKNEREEVRCRAVLMKSDEPCSALGRPEEREECKGEVRRWASAMGEVKKLAVESQPATLELTLTAESSSRPVPFPSVKLDCASFGAVGPDSGDTALFALCDYHPYGYRRMAGYGYYAPEQRTKVRFEFKAPPTDSATVRFGTDALFSIQIREFGEFGVAPTGEIKFSTFERRRGGRLAGTFKVTVASGTERISVDGKFDSFIRDLVSPSQLQGPSYGGGYGAGRGYGLGALGVGAGSGTAGILGGLRGQGGLGGLGTGPRPVGGLGGAGPTGKQYAAVLTSATLTPLRPGPANLGYRMTGLRPGGIWERLGVKEGDEVLHVGSVVLRTMGDVVRVRGDLQGARQLAIKLRRGGRIKRVVVPKRELERIQQDFYF
ncbi:MAG: hypothetical protein IT371_14970 [Deltaproteobacteria bacterium]|nr:hypothetical protein [Deltaproteobacteria bacterium]